MTPTKEQATPTLEHSIGPRGRFLLRQSSGEIAVRGVEGDTVRVRSLDGHSLTELFNIETGDDHVELRQIEKLGLGIFGGRREGADLAIEVPHGAEVSIDAASADIEATDLSGAKRFRTASGEVQLRRLAGAVDVETVSGEIELDGQAPLDVTAKSVSGDLSLRVPTLRRADIGTTSGDIQVDAELTGDGPFAIRTISGDVVIVGRNGFRVEAESITGDLSSDLPSKRESMPGRRVLIVGRPGATLRFRSVSGDFHVKQPRDVAPTLDAPAAPEPPVLPRAAAPATPAAPAADAATPSDADAGRLEILRALERGDITVAQATDRLSSLDEVLR